MRNCKKSFNGDVEKTPRRSGNIEEMNSKFERRVKKVFYSEDPEIRMYEDKMGKKMSFYLNTLIRDPGAMHDYGACRIAGGSARSYKVAGFKSRSELLGHRVSDIECLSSHEWKVAADKIIEELWPTCGIMSGFVRRGDSHIPRFSTLTPLVVDGKKCFASCSIQLSKWPDKNVGGELDLAARCIKIFRRNIAPSDMLHQFVAENLREYLTVHENGMLKTNADDSTIDSNEVGENTEEPNQSKKEEIIPNAFFRPGDRVEIHSLGVGRLGNGVTGRVFKVLSERRSGGRRRIRVQIMCDDPAAFPENNGRHACFSIENVRHIS